MFKKTKQRAHDLLYNNPAVEKSIYLLIILNILALIMESIEGFRNSYSGPLRLFEVLSVIIFTIEYLGRVYVSNIEGSKRRSFILSFYGIVDVLSILPFYLPFVIKMDLRVLRILRVFRFTRIFKLGRFTNSFKTIRKVIISTKNELLMTLFIAFILLLISSTLMYYVENDVQPEKFKSIPHAFWWAIATMTTVGYGDIYPVTAIGKFISSIIAIIGIGFVALPTGILSSAFMKNINKKDALICHNCGKNVNSQNGNI